MKSHTPFLQQLPALQQELFDKTPGLKQAAKQSSLHAFLQKGMPTRHDEHWKYTPLTLLDNRITQLSAAKNAAIDVNTLPDSYRLVFLDGFLVEEQSDYTELGSFIKFVSGAAINAPEYQQYVSQYVSQNVSKANHFQPSRFYDLNDAFYQHLLIIDIPADTQISKPIHLLHLSSNLQQDIMLSPRHVVILGERSQLTLVEEYCGIDLATHFNNVVTQIVLNDHAQLNYCKLQNETANTIQISNTMIHLNAHSSVKTFHLSLGGNLYRENLHISLRGENAQCCMHGFYHANGTQLMDYHTEIEHASDYGISQQHYKGILADKGRGVFNGKILVHKDIKQNNAQQFNHNILRDFSAEINSKPELEIYARDVQCSHGATVGCLDEEALSYLRSRGISSMMAEKMLVEAFAKDVFEQLENKTISDYCLQQWQRKL